MAERRPGDGRLLAGALAVLCFAVALRLGSLWWTPLPFNTDAFSHAGIAERILETGRLPLDGLATDQVGFASLLSFVSALAGDTPLYVGQPTAALVGALSVLAGAALTHRLALAADWPRDRARAAGLLAALLLAVEGVYLYRTMATDEQTLGFLLVPVVALAAGRWVVTGGRAWAAIGVLTLAPLGPIHNLTGLVAAVAVTVVAGASAVRSPTTRTVSRSLAAIVLTWTVVLGYHAATVSLTAAQVVQADRLLAVPGLFLAWVVLATLGAAWFLTTSETIQRGGLLAVAAVGFGLLAINALRPIFPGTTATPRALLVALLPLAIPAALAASAAHRTATAGDVGVPTVALVAGPLAFVGTGLTAALTPEYLATVWRSHLFAHVALGALAAVGAVALAGRLDRRPLRAGVVVLVLVATVASAPIAYSGLETRTFTGVTTTADFAAADHAADVGRVATDDHLARVLGYHGGSGSRQPIYDWLRAGGAPPPCPTLASDAWTGIGAQLHPQRPASLSDERYASWLARNHVTHVTVGGDTLSLVRPRGPRVGSCGGDGGE